MTPDEAAERQKRYREKRRRWAWKTGRPYSQDQDAPPPCVLEAAEPEG